VLQRSEVYASRQFLNSPNCPDHPLLTLIIGCNHTARAKQNGAG